MDKHQKKTQFFTLSGIRCASCVNKIESTLNSTNDVAKASVNFADKSLCVVGDISEQQICKIIQDCGYEAKPLHHLSSLDEKEIADKKYLSEMIKKTIFAFIVALPLIIDNMFFAFLPTLNSLFGQATWFLIGIITLLVMIFSAKQIYHGAWQSFRARNANMDTLIAIGTLAAWFYSMIIILIPNAFPESARHVYFETALIIIALIDLGAVLETHARGKTSEAIKRLLNLQPKTARIVKDNQEIDMPLEAVEIDDILRIRPGEKIPVDGVIIEGHSSIDESMLTGEAMPLSKKINDEVVAGTLNKQGTFLFKATRIGEDTALARIIDLVRQAQNSKPAIGRLVDVISSYFVPVVLICAVITAFIWFNFGPEPKVLYIFITAITVLIIACPCALGLGTPMSIMVGVGKAAEKGILIRNGEALQKAGQLQTIILDKTGTITEGHPSVIDIISFSKNEKNEILKIAASLEKGSEHPLAEAIQKSADNNHLQLLDVTNFNAVNGKGVSGNIANQQYILGNEKLLQDNNISFEDVSADIKQYSANGKTPIFLADDHSLLAMILIADELKKDSKAAIERLHKLKMKIIMLSGDNENTANYIAKKVNIDKVYANVLPHEKLEVVASLQKDGSIIAMVGDGINDAPALAKADVGFAIGAGTDVAIESADITLMQNSLHSVADAIIISRATIKNIKQNLFGAFIYNVLGIPLAAGLLYPLTGMLLHPMFAAAAMAMSSLTIVVNANRLRLIKT